MSRCYSLRWYQKVDTALCIKNASIFYENLESVRAMYYKIGYIKSRF